MPPLSCPLTLHSLPFPEYFKDRKLPTSQDCPFWFFFFPSSSFSWQLYQKAQVVNKPKSPAVFYFLQSVDVWHELQGSCHHTLSLSLAVGMRQELITPTFHHCFQPLVIHAQQISDSHSHNWNMGMLPGWSDIAHYHHSYSAWAHWELTGHFINEGCGPRNTGAGFPVKEWRWRWRLLR